MTCTKLTPEKRSLHQIQGGSLRHRLRIEIDDGTYESFVINKLNAVIDAIYTYIP